LVDAETTIGLKNKTKDDLQKLKKNPEESFENVVRKLIDTRNEKENKIVKVCNSENYIKKKVKPHGNGAFVTLPSVWLGEIVLIVREQDIE
jgi:putative transposon-encoded protein